MSLMWKGMLREWSIQCIVPEVNISPGYTCDKVLNFNDFNNLVHMAHNRVVWGSMKNAWLLGQCVLLVFLQYFSFIRTIRNYYLNPMPYWIFHMNWCTLQYCSILLSGKQFKDIVNVKVILNEWQTWSLSWNYRLSLSSEIKNISNSR